ncbi:MAG: DHHA1 domain-containing protein [Gemmatimonadota bacterium]
MSQEERDLVEATVNEAIWADHPVEIAQRSYEEAVRDGAMALFGEKYADEVRVVRIPGVSMELCGGTHVGHTGEIGLFRLVSESGVAAGVRRVEALTGPGAFGYLKDREARLEEAAVLLKTQPENIRQRMEQLLVEKADLESLLDELRRGGGAGETEVIAETLDLGDGRTAAYRGVRLRVRGSEDARKWGDAFLDSETTGVAVVAAEMPGEKRTIFAFVTDDLISRGVRADTLVRDVAAVVGGRGGGRPHMAQAGVQDPARLDEALAAGPGVIRSMMRADAP